MRSKKQKRTRKVCLPDSSISGLEREISFSRVFLSFSGGAVNTQLHHWSKWVVSTQFVRYATRLSFFTADKLGCDLFSVQSSGLTHTKIHTHLHTHTHTYTHTHTHTHNIYNSRRHHWSVLTRLATYTHTHTHTHTHAHTHTRTHTHTHTHTHAHTHYL